MSGSRTAVAARKARKREHGRAYATCVFCRQPVKKFKPHYPVKQAGKVVGFAHPGCGLRGATNNDMAKRRRILAMAGVERGR